MTQQSYRDIEDLLRKWSHSNQPSTQHLDQLARGIEEKLATEENEVDQSDIAHSVPGGAGVSSDWSTAFKWMLSVAAVVLVVVVGARWMVPREGSQHGPVVEVSPADPIESISDAQRQHKQKLLADLDRMFDGKRVWFAETESDVVLGGDDQPSASDLADQSAVVMRLVLARRSSPTRDWQRVWTADVVSRTDQVVQFVSQEPQQPSATVTAWTHMLPDGMIACDVDLKWQDENKNQLTDSLLLSPGETQTGASLSVGGIEYRLFHTVAVLDENTT